MKFDVDTKERIKVIFLFIFQSYKILMGCMLVLFVPQVCDEEVCTLSEKLENRDDKHMITLFFNGLSVLLIKFSKLFLKLIFCKLLGSIIKFLISFSL